MFVGLGLETGQCYQLDVFDVVGVGFNYVLLGGPGLVLISAVYILFFLLKIGFWFETTTSGNFFSQRTVLETWVYATLSVYKSEEMSWLIFQYYFLEIDIEIVTATKDSTRDPNRRFRQETRS